MLRDVMKRSFLLVFACGCGVSAVAQTPVPPATLPTLPPTKGIPPRDPRLPALPTQGTTVPPRVVVPLPPSADIPNRPLTADEAARIALRLQPNVLIARAGITQQRGLTRQIGSALNPQFSVLGSYTHLSTLHVQSGGGTPPTGTIGGVTTGGTPGTNSGTGTTDASGSTGTSSTGATGTSSTGTGSTGLGGSSGGTGTGAAGGGTVSSGTSVSPSTTSGSTLTSVLAQGFLAEITGRQLIYDFNHTRDLVRQSQALERAAIQNLTRTQSDLVLEVKQTFYTLTQDAQLVAVNEANVANRQAQLDLALSRYNVGTGLASDVVTAETAKAEAIQLLNAARGNEGLARANLAALMGIDPRTPIVPDLTGEPALASDDVNGLVQQALLRRPEVLQAQATVGAQRYGLSAARTTNAPVISGDVDLVVLGNQFVPQNSYLTVGVGVQFTPFDGGLTRGRVEQSRADLTIAQAQLLAAQINVKNDVTQAYINLRTAEQNVVAAQADVANAREGVRIAQGRYSIGLGQFLDIINAQAFLYTADSNLAQAQASVYLYRAAISHAIGNPIPAVR